MKKGSSDQPTVMENSHTAISLNLVRPAEAQLRHKSAGLRVQVGKVGIACVDGPQVPCSPRSNIKSTLTSSASTGVTAPLVT